MEQKAGPIPEVKGGDEAALLSRLCSGDESAFETMVRENQGSLYGLLLRMTGDPDSALDLVQETFIRAFRGLASFRGESAIRTWLHRIAVNLCLNEKRVARPETVAPETLDELSPGHWDRWTGRVPNPEELVANREQIELLGEALSRLPEEYRAVLLLRDREGYSAQESAEMLGISVPAVKSRLHRARLYVRKALLGKLQADVAEGVTMFRMMMRRMFAYGGYTVLLISAWDSPPL